MARQILLNSITTTTLPLLGVRRGAWQSVKANDCFEEITLLDDSTLGVAIERRVFFVLVQRTYTTDFGLHMLK